MANPNADLGALSVRRDAAPEIRPPRRWAGRVVVPGVLLAGFAGLAAWSAWDLIVPPRSVTVVPVVVRSGVSDEPAGQELFKANGWIEPRPLPVDVPVQTAGAYRVTAVKVNPGDRVRAGQELVLLDDAAARLDLEAAQKRLAKWRAGVASARAGVTRAEVAARTAAEAVGLAKAEAAAEVRAQQAEVTKADALLAAAELTLKLEEDLRRTSTLSSDV
jgi:multidrug efflux pump subunit AcrA (membrane-fusion protein)